MIESIAEWFVEKDDARRRKNALSDLQLYAGIAPSTPIEGITLCTMRAIDHPIVRACATPKTCGSCHSCDIVIGVPRCYELPDMDAKTLCSLLDDDKVQRSFLSLDCRVGYREGDNV
jgi:hypothetical protein